MKERNEQRAGEVIAECTALGLTIENKAMSYRIRGRGVDLHVASLGIVRREDLDAAKRVASSRKMRLSGA